MTIGYWTFDPPLEQVALFGFGREQPPEKWTADGWVSHPQALGYILETTEVTQQTEERVRGVFPDADLG